jgi:hypothetical protein
MSLKLIHTLYLAFAALVALVVAAWAAAEFLSTRQALYGMLALQALVAAPLLALLIRRFLDRVRGAGWL